MANKLDIIIAQDQATYRNLIKIKVMATDGRKKLQNYVNGDRSYFNKPLQAPAMVRELTAKITTWENAYTRISASYNARQTDLKTNPQSRSLFTQATDKVRLFFTQLFNSNTPVSGLGFAFIIPAIPVIWAVGVTAVTTVVAYFTEKYYSKSVVDYNESERAANAALAAGDPELARAILAKAGSLQSDQIEAGKDDGLFNQIGTGLKWGIAIGGTALALKVANDNGVFDRFKKKKRKKSK